MPYPSEVQSDEAVKEERCRDRSLSTTFLSSGRPDRFERNPSGIECGKLPAALSDIFVNSLAMPKITSEQSFDGAEALIDRLGLDELLAEVREIVTAFELLIEERKDANGTAGLRAIIDNRFRAAGGWSQRKSGGVGWIKRQAINSRPRHICIGVEVQVSGRSDVMSVDLIHLRKELLQGTIDLAVLVVPSDKLGYLLTDRVAKLSEAKRHIEMARAEDMPFVLIAIEHDGPGPALKKQPRSSKESGTSF